jgi:phi13 family phage major tail protein
MEGGVKIGLRDVHYAILGKDDEDGASYGAPVKMVGAITANINPNPSSETLFADDGPMETASQLGEIDLELNMADLPLSVQAVLLGHEIANGILLRKSTAIPPWLAIGFKSIKTNGKWRYAWLVKGKFAEPEQSHQTKEDTINFQTATITGKFVKREYDDVWIKQADEDEDGYAEETGTNWFVDGPDAGA